MVNWNLFKDTKLAYCLRGASKWGTLCIALIAVVSLAGCNVGPTACTDDTNCDDGDFCNGSETCDATNDAAGTDGCVAGTAPCAADLCDEATDSCAACNDDADCDNATYCDGAETCDAAGECVAGTSPCTADQTCDEANDECDACGTDADCDDGAFCNGSETCVDGVCAAGTDACTADQVCDETNDECDTVCDDAGDCDDGDDCTDDACVNGACDNTDVDCDDGVACTDDSCVDGACVNADNCTGDEECNLTTGECEAPVACVTDEDCVDDVFCNGDETCVDGACVAGERPCDDANGAGCDDDTATESCSEGDAAAVCTACPGETTDFTLGQDNLSGTTGNDTFLAALEFNPNSGTQIATLQTGDSANGLAGTDTLTASVNGTAAVPTLAGIENLVFQAFSATTITGTNISGVDSITSSSSTATLTVSSLQELTNVGLSGITDGASGLTISFTTAATTGSSDSLGVTMTNANAGTIAFTTGAANGFETVAFTSDGTTANVLTALTQTTGTSLVTSTFGGANALQVKSLPTTVRTFTGTAMTGALTLGTGTRADGTDTYTGFAAVDTASATGGTGNDVFIFGTTLDASDADQSGESINGGDGTDVVQATFASTLGSALPLSNVEELRVNATSAASFSLLNVTGISTITVESDDSATTMTVDNVGVTTTSQTWPTLAFRGDGTQAAQTYDTITYNGFGASASTGDKLTVNVGNRGTALNATGTTNSHTLAGLTIGSGSATGIEQVTIAATDGPLSVSGSVSINTGTTLTVTGSSNVGLGTVTAAADTITSVTASGVTGNFTATIDAMNGGTVTLGSGNDTVDLTGSAASATTIQGGAGNDAITGAGGADTIQGGAGTDTLIGAAGADTLNGGDDADVLQGDAGADTVTTGNGADTVVLTTIAASAANADTVSDFTAGSGGDQLEIDLSAVETSGATDSDEVVNFVELQDGSAILESDSISIHECTVGSACTPAANTNVIVMVGASTASTSALETALEAGGGTALVIAAAAGDVTSAFPVVYSDGTDAYLAICFAEVETTNNTAFEATDLVCINYAKMSSNTAITAGEFVAANFDYVP